MGRHMPPTPIPGHAAAAAGDGLPGNRIHAKGVAGIQSVCNLWFVNPVPAGNRPAAMINTLAMTRGSGRVRAKAAVWRGEDGSLNASSTS